MPIVDGTDTVIGSIASVELTFGVDESPLLATSWVMAVGGPHPFISHYYSSGFPHLLGRDSVELYLTGLAPTLVGHYDDTLLVLGPAGAAPSPVVPATDIGKHAWRFRVVE